jgi:hypothetical protein
VTKKPPFTATSAPVSAAIVDVFSRCATVPSCVAATDPWNVRGSMIATCTRSASAAWSAS